MAKKKSTRRTNPVKRDKATDQQIVAYFEVSSVTEMGIINAISLLNLKKVDPNTPADELRTVEYELGDQIAKLARVYAMQKKFIANTRAMRPPSPEMTKKAKELSAKLDAMTAASETAENIVSTSTKLFKIWRKTEA